MIALWVNISLITMYWDFLKKNGWKGIMPFAWVKPDQHQMTAHYNLQCMEVMLLAWRQSSVAPYEKRLKFQRDHREHRNYFEHPYTNQLTKRGGQFVNKAEKPFRLTEKFFARYTSPKDYVVIIGTGAGGDVEVLYVQDSILLVWRKMLLSIKLQLLECFSLLIAYRRRNPFILVKSSRTILKINGLFLMLINTYGIRPQLDPHSLTLKLLSRWNLLESVVVPLIIIVKCARKKYHIHMRYAVAHVVFIYIIRHTHFLSSVDSNVKNVSTCNSKPAQKPVM